MIRFRQDITTPVIHDNDMELLSLGRTAIMGSIRRDGLPRTRTSQQTSEYAQCLQIRYDLLHPHRSDMHLRKEVPISAFPSLVQTTDLAPYEATGEVSTRHRHVGMQEFLTQILTGGMRQVGRVDIPFPPFPSHAPSSR